MADVLLTDDAKEDLSDLDGSVRNIVLKAIGGLRYEPENRGLPLGSRAIEHRTGLRQLVVGDRKYRVVYNVDSAGNVRIIWVIGSRTDQQFYDMAKARIQMCSDVGIRASLQNMVDALWTNREP